MEPHRVPEPGKLTAEAFYERHYGERCELVEGEVRAMTPVGFVHGQVAGVVLEKLRSWARSTSPARYFVGVEVGFILQRGPDVVRAPDVYAIRREQVAAGHEGFVEAAPDLAVEILSPTDRFREVEGKVSDYLRAGTGAVWAIDPSTRRVYTFSADGRVERLTEEDTLAAEALLPGFAVAVSELFEG